MPAQIPTVLARVNGEAIEKWEFDNAGEERRAAGRWTGSGGAAR
jgi:hypothetical protein